ncbi:EamA family transporter [Diaminobutyricimonas sp. TR449]|uniref:EamA family transporter n=1 Tax=Diaminobutyricimonas sp. TR449 TaxID=2708076 RepID=UPI00141E269E|nr:EamA family transporter [Diaminobutyricimonas sp. TR449]
MNTLRATLLTGVAPALWGTTYLATTELLPADRPLLAATVRALPAGLLLLALARQLPTGSWWWKAPVLGALNIGVFFLLLFISAYRLPGGVAATVGSLQPIIVLILSALVLQEKIRLHTAITGLAGVTGVGLLVLQSEALLDPVGVLAGLGGAASMAAGLVLVKRWGRPVPLSAFTAWQLTTGGLMLLPALLLLEGLPTTISATNLVGFGYLALVNSVLGYSIWFWGLGRLTATSAAFLGLLSPIVATLLGWWILGQALAPLQLLGLGMALTSVIVAQLLTANNVSHRVLLTPLAER